MRLTVKVLPLTAANAPGPYQAEALAAFQQRVFALPVDAADTFELVWRKIEERYKNNYLAPQHSALFTIKKLQDGRDCDLDLGDTVGSIFGDEAVADRVVKVIPSFANRLFSMPPDTNLRPNSHKRSRLPSDGPSNKRARQQSPSAQAVDPDAAADGPVPSVESDGERAPRSHTGDSVTLLSAARHGQPQFTTHIKSESPELGAAKSPGVLKKPAHHSYNLDVATPDRVQSEDKRRSNQNSGELRTSQSSSVSGGTRNTHAPTLTPYAILKKSQLRELLLTRGLKAQTNGERNKPNMVQRLMAYDAQVNDTTIQETPQRKGRTAERKQSATRSIKKKIVKSLQDPSKNVEAKVNSPPRRLDSDKPSPSRPNSNRPSPSKPNSTNPSPSKPNSTNPSPSRPESKRPSPSKPESNRPSPSKPTSSSPSPSKPESTSPSLSRQHSTRSSPIAVREPAQWLAKSPSPHRLDSDADSAVSKVSSRSQSPIDHLDGDVALNQDTSDSDSNSKSDEEDEVEEEGEAEEVDVKQTPSPADPDAPPSAQPLRYSVIPDTQSPSTQLPASQPPPRSAQSNGGINAWFTSASQPRMRSAQAKPQPPSASHPVLLRRGPRNPGLFTSLKEMLKKTREQPNGVLPVQPKPVELKATDLGTLSQKKLPSALEEDSEDDESRDSSSSSSDEDS